MKLNKLLQVNSINFASIKMREWFSIPRSAFVTKVSREKTTSSASSLSWMKNVISYVFDYF